MEMSSMKIKTMFMSFVFFLAGVAALNFLGSGQNTGIMLLIDNASKQMDSHPQYDKWKASVISTTTKMNKNWQPEKVTVVKKIVRVINQERTEEIREVLQTEKGKTKDITEKYIMEIKKQREKDKEKERERKLKGEKKKQKASLNLSWEEIFPFNKEKRMNYEFFQSEDSFIDQRPVYVLESRARIKNENFYEGKYYICKDSLNVLRIELKPSKSPKHVKEFEIDMDFQVLPQGYFVLKKSKLLINGGIFIKHIRMTSEEAYSDYEIMNSGNNGIQSNN